MVLKTRVMMTPGGLSDISVSQNYYCIRSFSRLKTWNNVFEKFNNGVQKVIKHFFPEQRLESA